MRAQARRRFAQVIHMVVHSKACNTFSCQAGRRQRVSVPALARGGRHARRRSGLGLDDIVHDGGHRMLAARPAGQAARAPGRLPAVTLTVILPGARPRRSSCPGSVAAGAGPPGLRDHGHEPEREAPVPDDDRVQQLITGRQRPTPGRWPTGGVSARDGAAPSLAGSIPAPAGVPALAKTFLPGRIRQGPSMYEMEGPCPASPRPAGQLAGFAGAARRPPGPGTRASGRSPGSSHVPGVAPGWCPFPAVKAFLLPPRAPRKALRPAISCFSAIHGGIHRKQAVIRISQPLSTGLLTACPQATGVSPRTPEPLSWHAIG